MAAASQPAARRAPSIARCNTGRCSIWSMLGVEGVRMDRWRAISHLRGWPHGDTSAAEFRVVGRFFGAGAALRAGSEEEQPTDNGKSGDGDVAEGERPPRARLLPALTLPRFPCTPIPAAHNK